MLKKAYVIYDLEIMTTSAQLQLETLASLRRYEV